MVRELICDTWKLDKLSWFKCPDVDWLESFINDEYELITYLYTNTDLLQNLFYRIREDFDTTNYQEVANKVVREDSVDKFCRVAGEYDIWRGAMMLGNFEEFTSLDDTHKCRMFLRYAVADFSVPNEELDRIIAHVGKGREDVWDILPGYCVKYMTIYSDHRLQRYKLQQRLGEDAISTVQYMSASDVLRKLEEVSQ